MDKMNLKPENVPQRCSKFRVNEQAETFQDPLDGNAPLNCPKLTKPGVTIGYRNHKRVFILIGKNLTDNSNRLSPQPLPFPRGEGLNRSGASRSTSAHQKVRGEH